MRFHGSTFGIVAAAVIVGCAQPVRTTELNDLRKPFSQYEYNHTLAEDRRPTDEPHASPAADDRFVGIAISGGGSRSANFAAACLFELEQVGLLKHVDYISSVSGGSLTAAYYCTHDDFNVRDAQTALAYHFAQDALLKAVFRPSLLAGDLSRTDVLAEQFQRILFERDGQPLTFCALSPDRPRLLINATNLQTGRTFIFCNREFDLLNARLGDYPVANAVAASAAFPGLLHPVTLRDFSVAAPLERYVHLVDGGVSDNIGIQTLLDTYKDQVLNAGNGTSASEPCYRRYRDGAVFVIIDAGTRHDVELSAQRDIGLIAGIRENLDLATTVLLDYARTATFTEFVINYADRTNSVEQLSAALRQLKDHGHCTIQDKFGHKLHFLRLALTDVERLKDLPSRRLAARVAQIPTYFDIEQEDVSQLYLAARLLAHEDELHKVLVDLAAELDRAANK